MPKRRSPELVIMSLFEALSDDGKRIVAEWMQAQVRAARAPKSTAPVVARRSSRKNVTASPIQNTVIATGDASSVGNPICVTCGNEEGYTDHFRPAPNYHKFESSLRGKKTKEKILLPDDPDTFNPASIQ